MLLCPIYFQKPEQLTGFLTFPRGIEMEYRAKIGLNMKNKGQVL